LQRQVDEAVKRAQDLDRRYQNEKRMFSQAHEVIKRGGKVENREITRLHSLLEDKTKEIISLKIQN
jgi:hypothetical protein